MPEIKTEKLSLSVNGKTVDIKTPQKLNFELNKALKDDAKFAEFVSNPADFASQFGLSIDSDISKQLSGKLEGIKTLQSLRSLQDGGGPAPATLWAVAEGAYSVASTKIAVAF